MKEENNNQRSSAVAKRATCGWCLCRKKLTGAMAEVLTGAAGGAKGGPVREALVAAYPRLAQLLEEALAKLLRDTSVRLPFLIPIPTPRPSSSPYSSPLLIPILIILPPPSPLPVAVGAAAAV